MNEEIRVHVVARKGKNYFLRYVDPVTGKRKEKDSGSTSRRKALIAAGKWQSELMSGLDESGRVVTWAEFRLRYEDDHVAHMRPSTATTVCGAFNVIERVMGPDKLSRITTKWITRFQKLRLQEVAPATVEGDCRMLKAALNWAVEQGYLVKTPVFPKVRGARKAKAMKGRAVTTEEYERMVDAAERVPGVEAESLRYLMHGLWLSGLRIGEAIGLTWDVWADGIRVDLSNEVGVLLIHAEDEKGGQDREYAMAPEFDAFLRQTPVSDRQGHVFNVELTKGVCRNPKTISRKIAAVGAAAGVKVDEQQTRDKKTKKLETKIVWGSAHDLRRAFGHRWAPRVMPMVLKELMRHKTVLTTEKYYVGLQAQETGKLLRRVVEAESKAQKGELRGERETS